MRDPLEEKLAALARLSSADRRAVMGKLSSDEQRALSARAAAIVERSAAVSAPRLTPPACSPWLSRRLFDLALGRRTDATPAARKAVLDLVSERAR